jgi:hypothetical protein
MKESDNGLSHISSKLHMIYIYSNNGRHPITKNFMTLSLVSHTHPFNHLPRYIILSVHSLETRLLVSP